MDEEDVYKTILFIILLILCISGILNIIMSIPNESISKKTLDDVCSNYLETESIYDEKFGYQNNFPCRVNNTIYEINKIKR